MELPSIGLGTFKATGDSVQAAVKAAVQCGITHIDTAAIYKVGDRLTRDRTGHSTLQDVCGTLEMSTKQLAAHAECCCKLLQW